MDLLAEDDVVADDRAFQEVVSARLQSRAHDAVADGRAFAYDNEERQLSTYKKRLRSLRPLETDGGPMSEYPCHAVEFPTLLLQYHASYSFVPCPYFCIPNDPPPLFPLLQRPSVSASRPFSFFYVPYSYGRRSTAIAHWLQSLHPVLLHKHCSCFHGPSRLTHALTSPFHILPLLCASTSRCSCFYTYLTMLLLRRPRPLRQVFQC